MKVDDAAVLDDLKKRGGVALRDLARLADVNVSTVSRALNGDPRVNAKRARQIRQLATRLGYRPQPIRGKYAKSVGLLIGSSERGRFGEDYLERIAWYAQQLLGERRLHVNLECILRDAPIEMPEIVKQNRVDGVLLAGHLPAEIATQLTELGIPAVGINDSVERLGISCVRSEPGPAIHEAIVQLAARGHQRFALLMKNLTYPTSKAKYDSYIASLHEIGIEPDPAWLVQTSANDILGGRAGVRELIKRGTIPSTILCENDWVAVGALHELTRHGLSVPLDVSVMGHDDLWVCEQMDPRLTTIHRGEDQLVANAIDLLLEQVDGRVDKPREILVKGEMVWRDSTGRAPGRQQQQQQRRTPR